MCWNVLVEFDHHALDVMVLLLEFRCLFCSHNKTPTQIIQKVARDFTWKKHGETTHENNLWVYHQLHVKTSDNAIFGFFLNRSPWKLHTILYNYAWWYTYIVHDCMVYLRENHAWLIWLCVVVLPLLMYPWSAIKTNNLTKLSLCCTLLLEVQSVIFLNLLAFNPLLNTNLV